MEENRIDTLEAFFLEKYKKMEEENTRLKNIQERLDDLTELVRLVTEYGDVVLEETPLWIDVRFVAKTRIDTTAQKQNYKVARFMEFLIHYDVIGSEKMKIIEKALKYK